MLKKINRLKSKKAFKATYNNGNALADKAIVLYIGQEKDDKNCPTRVGFVVSKKVHKRAVVRNKIKRQMRETVRLLLKDNLISDNYKSLIYVARNGILNENNSGIRKSTENLTKRIANKNI